MNATLQHTVSEIVRSDYRTADVFQRYGINYCCNGQASLYDACTSKGLDCDRIISELESATRNITLSNSLDFNSWKISFLVDYVINVHHAYLYQSLPFLETRVSSMVSRHADPASNMREIAGILKELSTVMIAHNRYEEEIIFPYIKQLENAYRRKESYGGLFVRTLRKPLSNIAHEHKRIGHLLDRLRQFTSNEHLPAAPCAGQLVIFEKLKEFDSDLVQHKHLENNILFPRAMDIEKELLRL